MHPSIRVPTAAALADLVERCTQIDRYATQLAAAEETRVAALAAALVSMRRVLDLEPIPRGSLPGHHRRVTHWDITSGHAAEVLNDDVRRVLGRLVLDEHGQIKVLANKTWRGTWRLATLWRDGVEHVRASALLEYLAALIDLAQRRSPEVAQSLADRRETLAASGALVEPGPRSR